MDNLLIFFLGYVMLLGMNWLFKLEYRIASGRIKLKLFWMLFRVAHGFVIALSFAVPIIMLLNGAEFLMRHNVINGLVFCLGGVAMLLCSYRLFLRKKLHKEKGK